MLHWSSAGSFLTRSHVQILWVSCQIELGFVILLLKLVRMGEVIPPSRHSAFWLKPLSILGLFQLTTFIKRSHVLTIPLILAPYPP